MKYKNNSLFIIFSLYFFICTNTYAQNPIVTGFADPAMRIFDNKMYMVIGRDKGPETKNFEMPYWAIISSSDLRNWTVECYIDPKNTYLGEGYMKCWAADITFSNGKYFFYFSNGGLETGVLVADKISGPYVDVLKKPFLPKNMSSNHEYDPTAFTDYDGKKYIIYGRDGKLGNELHHYQIARLNEDMLSLAEKPRDLKTSELYGFGGENRARDHQYFHKYNDTYYLSCAGAYMTSKNIYGPYSNLRQSGQNTGHASFIEFNGQTYHAWEWTCDPFANRVYRQVMMTYVHYKDNGDMVDDMNFVQAGNHYANGVGSYNARWDTIEAEWYFKKSENIKKRESLASGFEIQNLQNGDYLNYPFMKDLKENATINFSLSSKNGGGRIEIREDSVTGKILGTCAIPKTGSFSKYQKASCKLINTTGTKNLYFVFKGGDEELARLDFFNFL